MDICTIYLITNVINNKIYVGQTWQSLDKRWLSGHGYRESTYFNSAIQKYGADSFKYEILALCSNQDNANYLEDYYMELYNSRDKNIGYNLKEGGSHGKHSEETKQKISIAHTGKFVSEETKQKLREINTGKTLSEDVRRKISQQNMGNQNNLGKTASAETKQKLSQTHMGLITSDETRQKISAANKGKKRSQDTINKMLGNTNNLGNKLSEETKDKISKSKRGRTWKLVDGKRVWSTPSE
jgi:group I intron endonuclease